MTPVYALSGRLTWLLCAALVGAAVPVASAGVAEANTVSLTSPVTASACSSLSTPIFERVNPRTKAALVSPSAREQANAAAKYGFTEDHGVLFRASTTENHGLLAVHRLWNRSGDFVWMSNPREIGVAVTKYGYTDQGVNFYASAEPLSCTVPVSRFRLGNKHRLGVSDADTAELMSAGWVNEGVSFHVAAPTSLAGTPAPPPPAPTPPPVDTSETRFSIAVYPDTQQEVFGGFDTRYVQRAEWLVANKQQLNLKYMLSVGDNVNWDTPSHSQYEVVSQGLKPLEDANIPYSLQIGNHDTQATGGADSSGGSCRQQPANSGKCPNTRKNQRDTRTINSYFDAQRFGAVAGEFEPGKIDNIYSTFAAGGKQWMVLDLELWPRTAAVEWAKSVVAAHPNTNVIVVTHSYLGADCSIYGGKDYGDNSPQHVYDDFIKQYANIKMVFSGHVGDACQRTDVGVHGNTVHSFLTAFHSATTNPIRLVTIDTAADSVTTRILGPKGNVSFSQYDYAAGEIGWI